MVLCRNSGVRRSGKRDFVTIYEMRRTFILLTDAVNFVRGGG